jgi:hypothetical protein
VVVVHLPMRETECHGVFVMGGPRGVARRREARCGGQGRAEHRAARRHRYSLWTSPRWSRSRQCAHSTAARGQTCCRYSPGSSGGASGILGLAACTGMALVVQLPSATASIRGGPAWRYAHETHVTRYDMEAPGGRECAVPRAGERLDSRGGPSHSTRQIHRGLGASGANPKGSRAMECAPAHAPVA